MRLEMNNRRLWPAIGASVLLLAACGGEDTDSASEVQEAAEELVQEVEEAATEVAEAAEEAAETVGEAATDMADAAEEMADEAATEAASLMDDAQDAAEEGMEMAEDAASGAMGAMQAAQETAEDAVAEVTEGAEALAEEAQAMASDVADAATGPVVHEIQMLNGDPDNPRERMVFRPDLVVAKPGDIIKFIPTDPSHQSSSVDGMLPGGADGWQGKVNEALEYTLPAPGVYGYKCVPHYAGGMVGLVVVQGEGMMDNVADAKKVRQVGLAKRRFDAIWARAEAEYLN